MTIPSVALKSEHVEFHHCADSNIPEVRLSGTLEAADYQAFIPHFEQLLATHGKLRLLVYLERDFTGWSATALWQDAKLAIKHFNDLEKIAIIGDQTWEKGMATFCKPFTQATVRYFKREQFNSARDWLTE